MKTLYINERAGTRFIKPTTKKLHYIFKETEELGKITRIYYLQFKIAELLWQYFFLKVNYRINCSN